MFAARNNAYQCGSDIKNLGYVRVFDADGTHAADQESVVVRQFGLKGRRAKAPEVLSVPPIISECAPLKIGDDIVGLNQINVVNDRKVIRVGNECDSDQPVDIECRTLSFLVKDQSWISITPIFGFTDLEAQNSADAALRLTIAVDDFATDASDATQVANLVAPLVSNDRSPFFNADDIHVTGCLSGYGGLAIKDPSHAPTFGGSAIMASGSTTYNRSIPCQ